MAISFRGSVVTPRMQPLQPQNSNRIVFAIINTFRSRSKVDVTRLVVQSDTAEAPTSNTNNRVMPIFRTMRMNASNLEGGLKISSVVAWDTQMARDDGVELRYSPEHSSAEEGEHDLTALLPTGNLWQQYTNRPSSNVEQRLGLDNSLLPALSASHDFILYPGQALIVLQRSAIPIGAVSFIQAVWEEEIIDDGFDIAGNVKLAGNNVEGARAVIITSSNADLSEHVQTEVISTNSSGNFSKTVSSSVKASVFIQHQSGGTKYTDKGKPFLEKS